MNKSTLSDYEKVSRISVDSLIADMFAEIEKLEETIVKLEEDNDSLRNDISDLADTVNAYESENFDLKEKIEELESEMVCARFPNRPSEFFELS